MRVDASSTTGRATCTRSPRRWPRPAGTASRWSPTRRRAWTRDALVLPGVGAFGAAAARLAPGREQRAGARSSAGLPCLGICLGMQLLFDAQRGGAGRRAGRHPRPGDVRLRAPRVPHIGLEPMEARRRALGPLGASGRPTTRTASSAGRREPRVVAGATEHEERPFPAAVRQGQVVGVQFHPEKSSCAGCWRSWQAFLQEVGTMIVIPAVDLREGACVQLVGGSYDEEGSAWTTRWRSARAGSGAASRSCTWSTSTPRRARAPTPRHRRAPRRPRASSLQVGGGVRDERARMQRLLDRGASGSSSARGPSRTRSGWRRWPCSFPGSSIVAADVRGPRGGDARLDAGHAPGTSGALVAGAGAAAAGGVLVTAVHKEGQLEGDGPAADGGGGGDAPPPAATPRAAVTTLGGSARAGAARASAVAVIGMALYTGKLDARAVAQGVPR